MYSQPVPPYAVFDAEWDYYMSDECDRGKYLAYFSIFESKSYAEDRDLYVYPGKNANSSDMANHEVVIASMHANLDKGDPNEHGQSGTFMSQKPE